ncbi:MAG: hypothetical protein WAK24_03985, partial [Candidatus Acidiferrales bacterium]
FVPVRKHVSVVSAAFRRISNNPIVPIRKASDEWRVMGDERKTRAEIGRGKRDPFSIRHRADGLLCWGCEDF